MRDRPSSEVFLRMVCGGLLWSVSALLSAGLFLAVAGSDLVREIVMVALAVGLEGAKILSWRMGRGFRVLAVCLILISCLGSLGATLESVEAYRQAARSAIVPDSQETVLVRQEVHDLDRQLSAILARLESLPVDFVSASRFLSDEASRLRKERAALMSSLPPPQSTLLHPSMFDLMAQTLGIPVETLVLAVLLFLSACLEAAALVLADARTSQKPPRTSQVSALSAQTFLEAAKDGAALPVLNGRDQTAKRLGISGYQAKKLVQELCQSGTVRVSGRRLALVSR